MHENLRALRWVSAWNSSWVFTLGYKWWKLAFQSRCVKIAMPSLTPIGHFGIVWEQIFIFFVCKKQIANYNPGQIHARWLHRQRPLRQRPRKPAPLPLSITTKILEKKNNNLDNSFRTASFQELFASKSSILWLCSFVLTKVVWPIMFKTWEK